MTKLLVSNVVLSGVGLSINLSVLGVMHSPVGSQLINLGVRLDLLRGPIVGSVHVLASSVKLSLPVLGGEMSASGGVFPVLNICVGVQIVEPLVLFPGMSIIVAGVVFSHGVAVVEGLVVSSPPVLGEPTGAQVEISSGSGTNLAIGVVFVDSEVFTPMAVLDSSVQILSSVPLLLDSGIALGGLVLLVICSVFVESRSILEVVWVLLAIRGSSSSVPELLPGFRGHLARASVDIPGFPSRFVCQIHLYRRVSVN